MVTTDLRTCRTACGTPRLGRETFRGISELSARVRVKLNHTPKRRGGTEKEPSMKVKNAMHGGVTWVDPRHASQ